MAGDTAVLLRKDLSSVFKCVHVHYMCICVHDMHCICLFCLAKSKFDFKLLIIIEEVHAINTNDLNKLTASGLEFKNTHV